MNWDMENSLLSSDIRANFICGTDEAGRGPLAGDVFAAAVILPHGSDIEGLNDSKQLSAKKREELYKIIKDIAVCFAITRSSVEEIDKINILNASLLAMRRATDSLTRIPDIILIDGNISRGFILPTKCITGGDRISPNIAAASILAKVERDKYMAELHEKYPEYNFLRNKGYPTREHREAVERFGASPIHRKSFLKKFTSI